MKIRKASPLAGSLEKNSLDCRLARDEQVSMKSNESKAEHLGKIELNMKNY